MRFFTTTVARILYALPFAVFGIIHFMNAQMMKNYIPPFFPAPKLLVYFTGAAMIAASVSILTKIQARLACLLLALLLGIFVVIMHVPGLFNPKMMHMALTSLLKDTSLAGAALLLAGIFGSEKK